MAAKYHIAKGLKGATRHVSRRVGGADAAKVAAQLDEDIKRLSPAGGHFDEREALIAFEFFIK
ncbi:hypothetical protein [Acidobacterium sp. S8]|uniref:hypothetical protein n=1 Tax=Acidobacterium sp. S8 TaxID=1641854 RepID=UPI00131E281E|nr:hypothetical protein [Acidobacterium sp. S8]